MFDGCRLEASRSPASAASIWRPTPSSSVRTAKRYDSALRFGVRCTHSRSSPIDQAGVPGPLAGGVEVQAGPVVHGPSARRQRRADLGVALDVEAGEGQGVRVGRAGSRTVAVPGVGTVAVPEVGTVATGAPSVPFMVDGSVTTPGAESVAPPAGLAVRISGATQAAAPAVANRDMRPIAWRLERRDSPGIAGDAATSPSASSLDISTTVPHSPGEGCHFTLVSGTLTAKGVGGRRSRRIPACTGHGSHTYSSEQWPFACTDRARGPAAMGRHDERMGDDAATVTERTATLLWEACRRDPDPAAVRRALAGGADLGVGGAGRLGPADRRAAVAGARRGRLVGGSRPRPGHVGRHGRRLQDGGAPPAPPRRRARRASAHRRRTRAGRLQGPGRGGPLPRARLAADGRHRPAVATGRSPARPRRAWAGPGGR